MPTYVPIIHVLLHRLLWELGNQISCLLWQLGEQQVWSLTVHYRHAVNGNLRVPERCWVGCESTPVLVGGMLRQYGLRQASRLCICGWIKLVSSQSPRQLFNGFVNANGEDNRNQKSAHKNIPTSDYKKFSNFVKFPEPVARQAAFSVAIQCYD